MIIAFRASGDAVWTLEAQLAKNLVRFAGGQIADDEEEGGITHCCSTRRVYFERKGN
jgi:DNA ligase-4